MDLNKTLVLLIDVLMADRGQNGGDKDVRSLASMCSNEHILIQMW